MDNAVWFYGGAIAVTLVLYHLTKPKNRPHRCTCIKCRRFI